MRVGHKYVPAGHTTIDASAGEHAATMGYATQRYESAEAFLEAHDARWVRELNDALRRVLDPSRTVLSIGSGEGEHDVLLHRQGFDVIASDLVPGALDEAARLFPGLRTMTLDVLSEKPVACDDILATGLEFYFDDPGLDALLRAVRRRLPPGGGFILVQRYRDNLATRVIDEVGLPLGAAIARRRGAALARKAHGYRRSTRELLRAAERAGFRPGRVEHAAFGMELARVATPPAIVVRLDRRLHVLNSAVVLELLATGSAGA